VHRRKLLTILAGALVAFVFAGLGLADALSGSVEHVPNIAGQPNTNSKSPQVARPNILSRGLQEVEWARGSFETENSVTPPGSTFAIEYFGYDSDVRNAEGEPAMLPLVAGAGSPNLSEATKTEPDKNVYLRLGGQRGADPDYDYGSHFVFQGHENGPSYLTRVNLDADGRHRVTLLTASMNETKGAAQPLPNRFDGITWDPFAQRLLGTFEDGANGGVVQFTAQFPSQAEDLFESMGRAAYEGVQNDLRGNVYLDEDASGPSTGARRAPNSYVYRFVPVNARDLTRGKLQALQVLNENSEPIDFEKQLAPGNPDQNLMRTYGVTLRTRWITIHDTESTVTPPSPPSSPWPNANALAKAFHATPFKRPENGVFRPNSNFREYYFDETGDTNALSTDDNPPATEETAPGVPAGTVFPTVTGSGGWGSIFKLIQSPSSVNGRISLFYSGDIEHAGFDNVQFLTEDKLIAVEDAGDTLHTQRKKLDSGYILDVGVDYSSGAQPVRWLAEGRDPSATLDSQFVGTAGFRNDGDNEITGPHVSDGDPSSGGILGMKTPTPFQNGWRWFWTQQHGDNVFYEVIPSP